jgi:acetyl esterase/lipase
MADSMLDAVETPAPDIADLLREPGAVALLVAYSRMPQGPARDRLVAFVESLSDQVKR